MRTTSTFTASAAATLATPPAGGTIAVPNPSASGAASALMLSNPSAAIVNLRFAATAAFAPTPMSPGLEDLGLNPGGSLLVTNPAQVGAAFLIVAGGTLSATPGSVGTSITLNS